MRLTSENKAVVTTENPEIKLCDTEFSDIARMAAQAFRKIGMDLRDNAENGFTKALIARLRSGRGLDPAECEVLADLISGNLCKPVGRREKNSTEKQRRRDIYSRYHAIMKQHRAEGRSRGMKPLAIAEVASEFKPIAEMQVESILRDKKMRD
jgi:hypothetical protein